MLYFGKHSSTSGFEAKGDVFQQMYLSNFHQFCFMVFPKVNRKFSTRVVLPLQTIHQIEEVDSKCTSTLNSPARRQQQGGKSVSQKSIGSMA
mmetsp:Transcript_13142/g.22226  ORF Transcript_13142/g.22226 Transcript_13142/m.22226 type:complete len:92 (-) Transcript_13142:55-330(-)